MQTYQITRVITSVAFVEAENEDQARELAESLDELEFDIDDIDETMELRSDIEVSE